MSYVPKELRGLDYTIHKLEEFASANGVADMTDTLPLHAVHIPEIPTRDEQNRAIFNLERDIPPTIPHIIGSLILVKTGQFMSNDRWPWVKLLQTSIDSDEIDQVASIFGAVNCTAPQEVEHSFVTACNGADANFPMIEKHYTYIESADYPLIASNYHPSRDDSGHTATALWIGFPRGSWIRRP